MAVNETAIELFTNGPSTTVAASQLAVAAGTTQTWTVASSTGFPAVTTANGQQFHISDPAVPTELIIVTNISGVTWTVIRGAEGTTPVAHAGGFTIQNVLTAGFLNRAVVQVMPSGDTTGVTDTALLSAANAALPNGGKILLGPGNFYVTAAGVGANAFAPSAQTTGGTTGGAPVSVQGVKGNTTIFVVGSCTGIYYHRSSAYPAQPFGVAAQLPVGSITDLTIDLTNAAPGATGLDIGDGWGHRVQNVHVVNGSQTQSFTATLGSPCVFTVTTAPANGFLVVLSGASLPTPFVAGQAYYVVNRTGTTFQLSATPGGTGINSSSTGSGTHNSTLPWRICNRVQYTEKSRFQLVSQNNAVAGVIDNITTALNSHKYCEYDLEVFMNTNMQGVIISASATLSGRGLFLHGNSDVTSATSGAPTNNVAALNIMNSANLTQAEIRMNVEGDTGVGTGTVFPYGIYGDGTGFFKMVTGLISHSLSNGVINGAEFSFNGVIENDTALAQLAPTAAQGTSSSNPAVPATTVTFKNTAPANMVYVTAGASSCAVFSSGNTVTVPASGLMGFYIPGGGNIKLTYSNAPTWVWMSAVQSQF